MNKSSIVLVIIIRIQRNMYGFFWKFDCKWKIINKWEWKSNFQWFTYCYLYKQNCLVHSKPICQSVQCRANCHRQGLSILTYDQKLFSKRQNSPIQRKQNTKLFFVTTASRIRWTIVNSCFFSFRWQVRCISFTKYKWILNSYYMDLYSLRLCKHIQLNMKIHF